MKQRFTWFALLIFLSTVAIGQGPARDREQNGPTAWPGFSREQPSPENILRISLGDEEVLKLDSLVSGKSWKERFLYDDMGNLTHQYYMEWDADSNQWLALWGLSEYVYDVYGKLTQYLQHYWDYELYELVVLARTEYEYNENDHLVASNKFHLDQTDNDWELTYKSEFEYDDHGKMTRRIQSGLNSSTGEWVTHFMSEFAYDDHGNTAEERIWERVFDWATETEQFRISLKREYIYFAAGQIMEIQFFTWHVQSEQWVSYSRHVYDYDNDDRLVLFTAFDPVENGIGWVAHGMEEYQYDLNGNMEQYSISDYDASSDQWIIQSKSIFLYDHSYFASELWLPPDYSHWRNIVPVNMMTEFNLEYYDEGVMMRSTNYKMHYSSLSAFEATNVQDPGLTGFSVYPNPASDILQVRSSGTSGITRFELFDTQGRLIKALEFSGQVAISLSDFRPGIYLYSLTSNGSRQTGKIVRE